MEYTLRAGIMDDKGTLDADLVVDTSNIKLKGLSPVPFVKSPVSYLPIPPPSLVSTVY